MRPSILVFAYLVSCFCIPSYQVFAQSSQEANTQQSKTKQSKSKQEKTEFDKLVDFSLKIPRTKAGEVLKSWLKAHNQADQKSLKSWMNKSFSPKLLKKMDFDKHLAWYVECTKMFGKLDETPHKIVENKPNRLVVQFISVDLVGKKKLDPTKVIIIKVDMDPDKPQFLAKGLGVGPLACEKRK